MHAWGWCSSMGLDFCSYTLPQAFSLLLMLLYIFFGSKGLMMYSCRYMALMTVLFPTSAPLWWPFYILVRFESLTIFRKYWEATKYIVWLLFLEWLKFKKLHIEVDPQRTAGHKYTWMSLVRLRGTWRYCDTCGARRGRGWQEDTWCWWSPFCIRSHSRTCSRPGGWGTCRAPECSDGHVARHVCRTRPHPRSESHFPENQSIKGFSF